LIFQGNSIRQIFCYIDRLTVGRQSWFPTVTEEGYLTKVLVQKDYSEPYELRPPTMRNWLLNFVNQM